MIIGIAGPARSGKDTAAQRIIKHRPEYALASFADPIKAMLKAGLGLSHEQLYGDQKETLDSRYGCTPRHIMQTLGTEWGRQLIHPDIWVRAMNHHLTTSTVIPDVRFENEAEYVRQRGVLIHITGRERVVSDEHISEKLVMPRPGDLYVINNGTLDSFYEQIDAITGEL